MNENLIRHTHPIGKSDRLKNNGHQAQVIWLVGLSGSGKSTLAGNIEAILYQKGYKTYLLDGDNVRLGLNNDLGFSSKDRTENIRRIAEVARLFNEAGIIVLSAFISPLAADRAQAHRLIGSENFIEILSIAPCTYVKKGTLKASMPKPVKD